MEVAIVADDLTGAADAAVAFTFIDYQVEVRLDRPSGVESSDVVAVDIASRDLDATLASARVKAAIEALSVARPRFWYKKLDSTLRGNVATELTACALATACDVLVVTPAYPAMGRTVIDGFLRHPGDSVYLAGQQQLHAVLAETPLATIPASLDQVRNGDLVSLVQSGRSGKPTILACDARTDADLDAIIVPAVQALHSGVRVTFGGSAGLAWALARYLGGSLVASAPPPLPEAAALLIVGTLHPMAREQLSALLASVAATPIVLGDSMPPDTTAIGNAGARALKVGNLLILNTPGGTLKWDGGYLAAVVADVAASLIRRFGITRVFVTGGEVARALCETLEITRMRIVAMLEEGIPVAEAIDGTPNLILITKAGGFGNRESLVRVHRYLAGMERPT